MHDSDRVRKAMRRYFQELLSEWENRQGTLPMAAEPDVVDPRLFVGSPNEEGWIPWRPVEVPEFESSSRLEVELGSASPVHPRVPGSLLVLHHWWELRRPLSGTGRDSAGE